MEGEALVAGKELRGRTTKNEGGDFCDNSSVLNGGFLFSSPEGYHQVLG